MPSSKISNGRRSRAPRTPVERFIEVLNHALIVNRISQRELCERLGITIGTLTKYLRGEVFPLNIKTHITRRLAEVRGVSLDSLLAYYETGEFKEGQSTVQMEQIGAWIRSNAGQEDMAKLLEDLSAAQARILADPIEGLKQREAEVRIWTDECAAEYGRVLRETFCSIAQEKSLGELQAWDEFRSTEAQKDKPPEYVECCQGVMSGKLVLTADIIERCSADYTECPTLLGLEQWVGKELPEVRRLNETCLCTAA